MRHHLLQSNWRASNLINFHSHRCRNRYVHGSTDRRKNTKHAIPVNMLSTIPYGTWQNTCSAQQHCHTVRQWGFPHSTVESNSHSNGKQHSSTTTTSIHLTSTRQRGMFPSNIDGTTESTRATAWKPLQHTTHKQTSHHAMDGAYLLNRYAMHADGNTSYYRRWNKEHKTPICEFGETILYMLPTAKQMPKMEARFFPAICLGKDTSTNENILGITNKVVRSRTIRRQVETWEV